MQTFFQDELDKLRKRLNKMFLLVNVQLEKAFQSVCQLDFEDLEATTLNENRIDKLDTKVDKLCQRIFALAQPVATDLRFIMSSLRIGNEIERIGDIALDIVNRSENLRAYPQSLAPYKIDELFAEVCNLSARLSEAYTNNNSELAKNMMRQAQKSAETCVTTFQEIIAQMTEKSDVILIATDLILVIRDLERITNHLENISESIVFIVEGKRLRHAP
jgi:phosphate transport system protein